ncbi:hypothetical protein MLD38_009251 [Melastoma candidum]|uniref:Uncharacterized protein n=1 Tax=Melastoma candidum TaxID=119954 RepID=A0ACB9RX54_9MYRT|nr:hypothetical protein MLD38_009251 [Melastoma candidum]
MSGSKSLAFVSKALLVLSIIVHASVAATSGNCPCSPNPTTVIELYIQTVAYTGINTNYTIYAVAGIQGTNFGNGQFGTVSVFDDPVTIAASPTSTSIGRSRGIYAVADLNGGTLFITSTFQFTGGQYANSSLNIKGIGSALLNVPMHLSIDGGTNFFNDAKGNVTLVAISNSGPNSVARATINTYKAI